MREVGLAMKSLWMLSRTRRKERQIGSKCSMHQTLVEVIVSLELTRCLLALKQFRRRYAWQRSTAEKEREREST